jgi:hypothetical protein
VLDGVQDRIGAADAKIGVAAGLELGVLTATAALGGTRTGAPAVWNVLLGVALTALSASILVAISALTPRIHHSGDEDAAPDVFFFGTLRHLDPAQMAERLRSTDLLEALARQSVHTSAIAWTKHVRLRWSLRLAATGLVLAALCAVLAVAW